MEEKGKILVIDDEYSIRWSFERALKKQGYEYALAENGVEGLNLYKSFQPDLVLVDIRMPEMDGFQVLKNIKEDDPDALVIVMTAYTDMETTINAMKLGAYDFLSKPFNIDECLLLISRGLFARKNSKKAEIGVKAPKSSSLKGNSPAMQEVYKLIGKVSLEDVTVLVTGESGCGKELVSQAIHYNSKRAQQPFWAINCTAINESLMESELFGYEKGAFTGAATSKSGMFELAQGGTIFLDEIGDMSLEMQAKLLRVLEEREIVRVGGNKRIKVDVRVIAATNQDLRKRISEGKFREDLYHRIKVIEIKLPSLRERKEDIPLLGTYFCSLLAAERSGTPKSLSDETINVLLSYDWPGNVRELRNAIEQAYTLSRDTLILPEHLPIELRAGNKPSTTIQEEPAIIAAEFQEEVKPDKLENTIIAKDNTNLQNNDLSLNNTSQSVFFEDDSIEGKISNIIIKLREIAPDGDAFSFVQEKFERELIKQCLITHKGNQVQTANYLGITRNTLRTKIEKYHIQQNE